MQQELTAGQKETKQGHQLVAELKVANANLENQVANLKREIDEQRQEVRKINQANAEFAHGAENASGLDDHATGDRVPLAEAQE